jgi:hypothetical protein
VKNVIIITIIIIIIVNSSDNIDSSFSLFVLLFFICLRYSIVDFLIYLLCFLFIYFSICIQTQLPIIQPFVHLPTFLPRAVPTIGPSPINTEVICHLSFKKFLSLKGCRSYISCMHIIVSEGLCGPGYEIVVSATSSGAGCSASGWALRPRNFVFNLI